MDAAVINALAKWPQVPACYGWLGLDARGTWRLGQGRREPVRHAGLAAYLARNYATTAAGEWFVQNGPQRVYVELEAAPLVTHFDGARWRLHTDAPLTAVSEACVDEFGALYVRASEGLAVIDDRDLGHAMQAIRTADGATLGDEQLAEWLGQGAEPLRLTLAAASVPLQRAARATLPARYGFVRYPQQANSAG